MRGTYLKEEPDALQAVLLEDLQDDFDDVGVIRQQRRVLQNVQKRLEHDVLEAHVRLGANILDRVLDVGRFDGGLSLQVLSAHQ